MTTETVPNDEQQRGWPKPVVLGSLAVIGVSLVLAILYPRARAAIGAAVIISPIPPIP
jgi:hypothetical protein